jgi:glycosyltransferase involved in cell wall biosynthesis
VTASPSPASGRARPPGDNPAVTLTVPLYDEVDNVDAVARSLVQTFRQAGVPLILQLVDNGSRDGTRQAVRTLEAELPEVRGIYLDVNQGYGGGILAGMRQADTPVLGYLWGDGQVAAVDVIRVYRRLVSDKLDVCKARRVQRADGWQRDIVTRVYNTFTLWWFHITSNDTNGCPKVFTAESWAALDPQSTDWFLDLEIMIGVAQQVLKQGEVDVVAQARDFGTSKVGVGTILEFARNMAVLRVKR